ncbi:hypothetical protein H4R18_001182 [Coemansia javaensis]|uniref:Rab-GAP TBC domain-containing protein n=1 Tax=Coemansia javaensis TaxID=2761396 RepID=A0A9W8HEH1_9FUNG|nr:hypothetical protein H4R18_001182 [Coemansia javaensis]
MLEPRREAPDWAAVGSNSSSSSLGVGRAHRQQQGRSHPRRTGGTAAAGGGGGGGSGNNNSSSSSSEDDWGTAPRRFSWTVAASDGGAVSEGRAAKRASYGGAELRMHDGRRSLPGRRASLDSMRGRGTIDAQAAAAAAVAERMPPPPTPQFLRQLGVLQHMCAYSSGGGAPPPPQQQQQQQQHRQRQGPSADRLGLGLGLTPHFEALVNAAHMPEFRGAQQQQQQQPPLPEQPHQEQEQQQQQQQQQRQRVSSRLARFTRRLLGGLLFGPRHSGGGATPTPADHPAAAEAANCVPATMASSPLPPPLHAASAVSTFAADDARLVPTAAAAAAAAYRGSATRSPGDAGSGSGSSRRSSRSSDAGLDAGLAPGPEPRRHVAPPALHRGGGGGGGGRARIRAPASRIAARRNVVGLTIPTARPLAPPPLLALALPPPAMLAMPALSPACTLLNSEAVTACSSALASPGAPVLDAQLAALGRAPLPTAPVPCAHASPAHGMLCRLAATRCSTPQPDDDAFWARAVPSASPPPPPPGPADADADADAAAADRRLVPCLPPSAPASLLSLDPPPATAAVAPLPRPAHPDSVARKRLWGLAVRGIPPSLRRQAWMECAAALDLVPPSPAAAACDLCREDIELDLPRTADSPALRHVLYGYAAASPDVGYCQGMDRIAHGLLRAGLGAADALAMLRAMLDGGVLPPGMFRPPMVSVQADQRALEVLVARHLPRLADHLRLHLPGPAPLAPVTVSWFLTLFVDCLPEPLWLRVWDVLLVRGYPAVFHACLAILELVQDDLLRCTSPAAIYTVLQDVRAAMDHVAPDAFADCAFARPAATAQWRLD